MLLNIKKMDPPGNCWTNKQELCIIIIPKNRKKKITKMVTPFDKWGNKTLDCVATPRNHKKIAANVKI